MSVSLAARRPLQSDNQPICRSACSGEPWWEANQDQVYRTVEYAARGAHLPARGAVDFLRLRSERAARS